MALSSQFISLPTELLLIILDFLSEPNLFPIRCGEKVAPTSYSIRHIRSLSLGSRRLRQLCLPLLFSNLKFTYTQQQELRLLEAKCAEDTAFAGLIRRLNLADVRSPDVLPSLLSRLQFLEWLDLDPCQVNGDLLAIANSHPNLKTVAFIDAVEREALHQAIALSAFSISRTGLASLDTWRVAALELKLDKADGIPGLKIASTLTPALSSLAIRMSLQGRRPIPVDDLVSALGCFPSLRRLDLHGIYQHLRFQRPAPWNLPPSDADRKPSNCMSAHAALLWIMARVAQCTPTLELVHFTDQGSDGKGRLLHPWRLNATYQVRRNPALDFDGTPQFVMAPRFSRQ
ncbi:hypothetical protein B0H17DRAFT_1191287 [Mycena rosella]|uniref:F-box domain-containing protein n=1 Tax=Mycena rosella TaxID=1033263 RepID=A0AAD7MAW0_MYCRO|nr:hypothetical protein B0H17DRAFT_1191287 [Mycena rosella]